MTDAWFSEAPRWLAYLSMLSLLAVPAERGRYRTAVTAVWVAALIVAAVLLTGTAIAFYANQPAHVVKTLATLGIVFGVAFGATFPFMRQSYRQAELRRTVAADL